MLRKNKLNISQLIESNKEQIKKDLDTIKRIEEKVEQKIYAQHK